MLNQSALLRPVEGFLTQLCIRLSLCLTLVAPAAASAQQETEEAQTTPNRHSADGYRYNVSTSLWTTHFNPQPEHNNTQRFLGLERYGDNYVTAPLQARFSALQNAAPLLGLAHFSNSYSQATWYAYAGFGKTVWQRNELQASVKITAGFIHGYRNEFQYKIPFNSYGTSPAAVPSVNLRYRRLNGEAILFGASGLMLNIGYSF